MSLCSKFIGVFYTSSFTAFYEEKRTWEVIDILSFIMLSKYYLYEVIITLPVCFAIYWYDLLLVLLFVAF
jgi:hypothetical protein